MSDNLKTFNEFVKKGYTESQAALQTFTGKVSIGLKFDQARITGRVKMHKEIIFL